MGTVHTTLEVSASTGNLETLQQLLTRISEQAKSIREDMQGAFRAPPGTPGSTAPGGGAPSPSHIPVGPGAPGVPGAPSAPGGGPPSTPGIPEVPEVPEVPGIPGIPGGAGMARLLGRGALGGAAFMAMRRLTGTFATAGYEEQAASAAGIASGDFVGAASGLSAAHFGRERAERGAVGGAIGTMGSGAMAAGGIGLTAGIVSGPVGWGLLAAGAIASVAAEIGTRIGDAQDAVLQAREQAAIQRMGGAMAMHGRFAESRMGMRALGVGGAERSELDEIARALGISPSEMLGRQSAYARAGGRDAGARELAELERGYGLSASDVAGFERSMRPGMGGMLRMGDRGALGGRGWQDMFATPEGLLRDQMIANARAMGVGVAALPQYLSAAMQQPLAGLGLTQDVPGLERERVGLHGAFPGLPGMMMPQIQQNMTGYGAGLLGSMADRFLPGDAVQAMVEGQLMAQFGGYQEGMAGLEGMMQDGTLGEFMAGIVRDLPPELRGAAARHMTGLAPGVAGALAEFSPGGLVAPGAEGQPTAAERAAGLVAGLPEGERQALTLRATQEAMEMLAFTAPQLADAVGQSLDILKGAIDLSREALPAAIKRLADEIDEQRARISGDGAGSVTVPQGALAVPNTFGSGRHGLE